jgi:hypothetical protein
MEAIMSMKQMKLVGVLVGAALISAGCELDVTNLNDPDRSRALAQASDLEALIGGTFGPFFRGVHGLSPSAEDGYIINYFPTIATEMTTTTATGRAIQANREPRIPYNVGLSIGATGEWGPRYLWRYLNQMASSSFEGLQVMAESGEPLIVDGEDVTARATAFAKLMQGVAWGYQAMLYDQAMVVPETADATGDPGVLGRESLMPWPEALDAALASIDEAISIAGQNDLTFPGFPASRLWFGAPEEIGSEKLIQYANTMAARLLVLSARNPAQRAQVDWNRVLDYTEGGLTTDLEIALATGFRESILFSRAQNNPAGCGNCYRLDNRLIGQADVSGAYQTWISSPLDDRNRFDIVTPDRRITGPTPQSDGAYTRYRDDNNGFTSTLYLFSAYQWARHAHRNNSTETALDVGTAHMATADENLLLRAEALIHLNRLDEAAELINVTRTRQHTIDGVTYSGLPPVTAAGVPQGNGCVPRTDSGACGDLTVALRYERMIELIALDAVRGYADSRGFGLLPEGTWLQLPVPPEELNIFGLSVYTFGGVGSEFGAVYAPVGNP